MLSQPFKLLTEIIIKKNNTIIIIIGNQLKKKVSTGCFPEKFSSTIILTDIKIKIIKLV